MRGSSQSSRAPVTSWEGSCPVHLIGDSPPFRTVRELIERIARCDATVLIGGETGTGKEVAARAIHYGSERRRGPFIPVNCGALPDALVESELFGAVRGAFTDARADRPGLVAEAAGGTLFLDEIDSLSPRAQVTLLRFLQDREYRPVGGTSARRTDVRILAATNANLWRLVADGAFRQDLLFRLEILTVEMPPLRARGDDAALLADAYLLRLATDHGGEPRALDPAFRASLSGRSWPGNVRELENLVHRAFLLSNHAIVTAPPAADALTVPPRVVPAFREAKTRAIEAFERRYLVELLTAACGNISRAARISGKERSRLSKLISKHALDRAAFKPGPAD